MAHDKRRVRVLLTPKTRKIAQQLIPRVEQRYALLEMSLGLPAMQEVHDTLDALLARATPAEETPVDALLPAAAAARARPARR